MIATKRIECPACKGRGVTEETAPVLDWVKSKGKSVLRTFKRGSGCPGCLGVGFVGLDHTVEGFEWPASMQ